MSAKKTLAREHRCLVHIPPLTPAFNIATRESVPEGAKKNARFCAARSVSPVAFNVNAGGRGVSDPCAHTHRAFFSQSPEVQEVPEPCPRLVKHLLK